MATASVPVDDDRDLECPVCHEPFRTPKMLPCGHTICLAPCLQQLAKDRESVKCPECRADHQLPGGRVDGFPTNIFIVRLLKTDVVPKKLPESFCPLCNAEEPLVKCFHCSAFVCESCRMMHTKELQAELLTFLEECAENKDFVAEATMEQASSKLQNQVKSFIDAIENVVAAMVENVQQRGKNLVKQVREYEEVEEVAISERVTDVAKKIDQLHEFFSQAISELKGQKSVTQNQLLKTKENATKQLSQLEESTSSIPSITEMKLDIDMDNLLTNIRKLGDFAEVKSVDDKCTVSPTNESQPQSPDEKYYTAPTHAAACNVSGNDETPNTSDKPPTIPGPSATSPPAGNIVVSLSKRDLTKVMRCVGREGAGDGQFNTPTCLAVCPMTENIVVGDNGNHRIQIFSAQGEHLKTIIRDINGQKFAQNIKDVAISDTGDIYVVEGVQFVHQFTRLGCPVRRRIGTYVIRAICLDLDERLHVCHGKDGVVVYDIDGKHINTYRPTSVGKFDARQIAISRKKSIYITDVDNESMENHYFVLNKFYQLVSWGDIPCRRSVRMLDHWHTGNYFYPGKMKIIEEKYFLIAHRESHTVYLFDLNWKMVKRFGVQGHCRGQFHRPTGSDVTKDGELVVISENNMLQFFQ